MVRIKGIKTMKKCFSGGFPVQDNIGAALASVKVRRCSPSHARFQQKHPRNTAGSISCQRKLAGRFDADIQIKTKVPQSIASNLRPLVKGTQRDN
jgi:hypothetical protein